MGKKKHRPMWSQLVGIAWIIAVLLIALGWYIFSSKNEPKDTQTDQTRVLAEEKLASKEDSAYRSRRKPAFSHRQPATYTHQKMDIDTDSMYRHEPPPLRKQILFVNLNTADTTTLQLLHGIGPSYARRIVRYRERLGGLVADSQLLEVYGFTPELLAHIRPYLEMDTSVRHKIAINRVGLKELARHPYVEYHQARDIVNLRSRGIVFHSEEDLRAIPSMADSTLARLRAYLDYALEDNE